ncbi:cation:proton antiporter [Paenibacillus sp. R14(2021)]|uniref:cation:proton antiporter n=1 Tax=Paenibacillus sp. R14(2021) TaxID=2859228 RepID=UPI001C614CEE|nr:cation:proton antiporter [Paenibacillus sp. R14(2021)]
MALFLPLMLIILSTKIAGDISVRLGQPSVLGKLVIGVVIGPAVLGWVQNSDVIQAFSHIGVLLLMFMAGLETDIKELNNNRNSSIAVAVGGIILPLLGGYMTGIVLGLGNSHAIFLGLLLSATSVSISVQTFRELGQLKSRESTTVLGAALVDDILVVITLAVMMSFLTNEQISISLVIGKKMIFFALVILVGWKVVPYIMKKFSHLKITEPVISTAFMICLFFSYGAEYLGIAGIIGAFAAGIAVSRTEFKHEVEKKMEPIAYAVFVPVFYVSIGLSVSFEGFSNQLGLIVGLTLVAVLAKIIGAGLGARLTGFNMHSSLIIGSGMVSRGEVALILATTGLASNLVNRTYFTTLVIAVILTTIATPPLLKALYGKQSAS